MCRVGGNGAIADVLVNDDDDASDCRDDNDDASIIADCFAPSPLFPFLPPKIELQPPPNNNRFENDNECRSSSSFFLIIEGSDGGVVVVFSPLPEVEVDPATTLEPVSVHMTLAFVLISH